MKYALNDVVMALDNGKLYEAKVLKGQNIGTTSKYFIHFQGWAKKFDVWIDEQGLALKSDAKKLTKLQDSVCGGSKVTKGKVSARLASVEPEIVSVESDLNDAENKASLLLIKRKADSVVTEAASQAVKKHRKTLALNDLVDNEKEEQDKFYSKVILPYNLKKHLIDEWTAITKDPKKLINLPRTATVETLIEDFLEERNGKDKNDEEVPHTCFRCISLITVYFSFQATRYRELFELLQDNFDKALPTLLLYRQERAQVWI
jgi:mortality factor 4-like protein 1